MIVAEKKKESHKASLKEKAMTKEKVAHQKEVVAKAKEAVAKEKEATKEKTTSKATIYLDESETKCTNVEEEIEEEVVGGAGVGSPFIFKNKQNMSLKRSHKKKKLEKSVSATPLVLAEGDLNEIGDVVHNATTDLWG